METSQAPQTPKTRKSSKKVVADLATGLSSLISSGSLTPERSPVETTENKALCAPIALDGALSPCGKFMYVTSHHLRRSVMTGDLKHQKLKLYGDQFRKITSYAMQLGITWDELLRAQIDAELASLSPFASAVHFVPEPA
jgi:hypothetical protein